MPLFLYLMTYSMQFATTPTTTLMSTVTSIGGYEFYVCKSCKALQPRMAYMMCEEVRCGCVLVCLCVCVQQAGASAAKVYM